MGTYKRLRNRFTRWWLRSNNERPLKLPESYDLSVPMEDWPSSWHLKRALELFSKAKDEHESMLNLMNYYGAEWDDEQLRRLRDVRRDLQAEAIFHLQMGEGMRKGWYET